MSKLNCAFFKAFTENEVLIKELFEKYDANKNGVIEKSELKALILDIAKSTGETSEELLKEYEKKFDEADINKDGVLTYEEFKKIGPEIVEKMLLA